MAAPTAPALQEGSTPVLAPHVLVCVAGEKHDLRLMRQGSLLAGQLRARMTVLFVLPAATDDRPDEALHAGRIFAEALQVPFVELPAYSVIDGIVEYTADRGVTHVVLSPAQETGWYGFKRESALNDLLDRLGQVDVFVLSDSPNSQSFWWSRDGTAP